MSGNGMLAMTLNDLDDAVFQLSNVDGIEFDRWGACTTCGQPVPAVTFKLKNDDEDDGIDEDDDGMGRHVEPVTVCICASCAAAIEFIARTNEEEHEREDDPDGHEDESLDDVVDD